MHVLIQLEMKSTFNIRVPLSCVTQTISSQFCFLCGARDHHMLSIVSPKYRMPVKFMFHLEFRNFSPFWSSRAREISGSKPQPIKRKIYGPKFLLVISALWSPTSMVITPILEVINIDTNSRPSTAHSDIVIYQFWSVLLTHKKNY